MAKKSKSEDTLKGGKGDNKTVEDIAKKNINHSLNYKIIEKLYELQSKNPDKSIDFINEQFNIGYKFEKEHQEQFEKLGLLGDKLKEAVSNVAITHLDESINYYIELEKMEKKLESENKQKEAWQMTKKEFDVYPRAFQQLLASKSGLKPEKRIRDKNVEKMVDKMKNRSKGYTSEEAPDYFWSDNRNLHKELIQQALSENKPVPENVLAEYPDLKQEKKLEGENENKKIFSYEDVLKFEIEDYLNNNLNEYIPNWKKYKLPKWADYSPIKFYDKRRYFIKKIDTIKNEYVKIKNKDNFSEYKISETNYFRIKDNLLNIINNEKKIKLIDINNKTVYIHFQDLIIPSFQKIMNINIDDIIKEIKENKTGFILEMPINQIIFNIKSAGIEKSKGFLELKETLETKPISDLNKQLIKTEKVRDEEVLIYSVNGTYVRDNYSIAFTMGGHHYVSDEYEYIPDGEIWIDQDLNEKDKEATIVHELTEYELMKYKDMSYEKAHDIANEEEKEVREEATELETIKKQDMSYDYKNLPIGTEIYYTGDQANIPDFGKITKINEPTKYSDFSYEIELNDGRIKKHILPIMFTGIGKRFWVKEEYLKDREEQIDSMYKRLGLDKEKEIIPEPIQSQATIDCFKTLNDIIALNPEHDLNIGKIITDKISGKTYEITGFDENEINLKHKPRFRKETGSDIQIGWDELLKDFKEKRLEIEGYNENQFYELALIAKQNVTCLLLDKKDKEIAENKKVSDETLRKLSERELELEEIKKQRIEAEQIEKMYEEQAIKNLTEHHGNNWTDNMLKKEINWLKIKKENELNEEEKIFFNTNKEKINDIIINDPFISIKEAIELFKEKQSEIKEEPEKQPEPIVDKIKYEGIEISGIEDGTKWVMKPAKYVKATKSVAFKHESNTGIKSRGSSLAEYFNGRYSHREKSYIIPETKANKLLELFLKGYDATIAFYKGQKSELIEPKIKSELEKQPELTKQDYIDTIEGLEIVLETLEGQEKQDYIDTIEGLKIVIETL